MPFKIAETFQVQAPVDGVWRFLIDPRQVVQCLPGAELTEAQDEQTFLGKIKVKVGPVTAGYNGRAQLTEVNDAEHVVRMTGEGRETGGAGSAKMSMTSRVVATASGGSEVRVEADVDVAGKIMQFGRGMIDSVSKQLFRQFAECARARLESPEAAPAGAAHAAAPASSSPSGGAATVSAAPPAQRKAPRIAAAADATRVEATRAGRPPSTTSPAQPHQAKPIRILPLIFRAIWSSITGLFRRRAKT